MTNDLNKKNESIYVEVPSADRHYVLIHIGDHLFDYDLTDRCIGVRCFNHAKSEEQYYFSIVNDIIEKMSSTCIIFNKFINGDGWEILYVHKFRFHRTDGPAYIRSLDNTMIETEQYYLNGKLHRTDGPALIYYKDNGRASIERFFLNDKEVLEDKFAERVKQLCETITK